MLQIKFSFIIPCLNSEAKILASIESIKAQSFTNYEIIVVDNLSTDHTFELVSKLEGVTLIQCFERGAGRARNKGLEIAQGEYIVFVDSDVVVFPNFLAQTYSIFERYPWLDGVAGSLKPARLNNKFLHEFRDKTSLDKTLGSYNLLNVHPFNYPILNTALCVVKKKVLGSVGNFDESFSRLEDSHLTIKLIAHGKSLWAHQEIGGEVYFIQDNFIDYFIRSFKIGVGSRLVNLSSGRNERLSFPLPDFNSFIPDPWFELLRWANQIFLYLGNLWGCLTQSEKLPPIALRSNVAHLANFRFKKAGILYGLAFNVSLIILKDYLYIFRNGQRIWMLEGKEKEFLLSLPEAGALSVDDLNLASLEKCIEIGLFIKLGQTT